MIDKEKIKSLKIFATNIRIETLKSIGNFGSGHIGGALSIADAIAVLYGGILKYDPKNPRWKDRDYLVCSKGHAGPAIYSALALKGFFPIEELMTLNKPGTNLPSHCDRNKTPGIDMTTGSLGQGASAALGIALGNMLDGRDNYTYLILGDGEVQEGQVWEAAMFAAQRRVDHLIALIDCNKKQLDGYTKDINDTLDLRAKFEAFGWFAKEIDGHNISQIYEAILQAKQNCGKPSAIVLNTVKGKGCSFVEKELYNHHMTISKEQMAEGLRELYAELEKVVTE